MTLNAERIKNIIDNIGQAKVLIIGDVMLDEYLFGHVNRISPEAPVPIVEVQSDKILLGGAANVAANIKTLGDEPILLGVVGDDEASIKVNQLLKQKSISGDYIITDNSRRTSIKSRVIAHSQQVVRTDWEDRHELNEEIQKKVFSRFEAVADEIKAVIISDYGKGVVSNPLLEKIIDYCLVKSIFIGVDPKETHFHNYRKVSLVTPNHHEAGFAYGHRIQDINDLMKVGHGLLKRLEAKSILITRGADGMSLFQSNGETTHIPTFARQVFDVTGAGDTVIASFVAAICAGASFVEAAVVSNAGAGITVREVGTATVTRDDLKKELELNIKNGNLQATVTSLKHSDAQPH